MIFLKRFMAGAFALACLVTSVFSCQDQTSICDNPSALSKTSVVRDISLTAARTASDDAVYPDVVSDCGDLSSASSVSLSSAPFAYTDLTLYEGKTITKLGVPVRSVSDYTADSIFTVSLASYDSTPSFTLVNTYKLIIPANTFSSNTVNAWYYFDDLDIDVAVGQTLGFQVSTDTVTMAYVQGGAVDNPEYLFRNKLFTSSSAVSGSTSGIYLDAYYTVDTNTETVASGTSYTINATVYPTNASDATLAWNLSWAEGADDSADISQYVTITVSSDTHTVIVKVVKAWPYIIQLTATSVSNNDVSVVCDLLYSPRISSVVASIDGETLADSLTVALSDDNDTAAEITLDSYTVGTGYAASEYRYVGCTLAVDTSIAQLMGLSQSYLGFSAFDPITNVEHIGTTDLLSSITLSDAGLRTLLFGNAASELSDDALNMLWRYFTCDSVTEYQAIMRELDSSFVLDTSSSSYSYLQNFFRTDSQRTWDGNNLVMTLYFQNGYGKTCTQEYRLKVTAEEYTVVPVLDVTITNSTIIF